MTPARLTDVARRWAPAVVIAVASTAYYAQYVDVGFNQADDGNYAQLAYELHLGRSPSELAANYGLLWFQIGAGLFDLFGVDYDLARWTMFGAIVATNLLIAAALTELTGRRWVAAALTAVPALAPAFPATAFYGLCVMLNVAAQMRFAKRWTDDGWRDAALAGVALSLSFQLRPDFGYAFAAPLAAIIWLRGRDRRRNGFAAGAAFLATLLPGLLVAAADGYAGALIGLYVGYPAMMIEYLWVGASTVFGFAATSAGAVDVTTMLQRPPVAALWGGASDSSLAWLIYLPVLGIAAFICLTLSEAKRHWRAGQTGILAVNLVALSGAAAFPHYFLFRPDMAHVANFMPGYVVLATALMANCSKRAWPRPLVAAAVAAVLVHLAVYGWIGVQSPSGGSIGIAAGRTERFQAENGVDVTLMPGEVEILSLLRDTVAVNSKPGDAIVCLPYCPGIAFMTARRMLHGNFYVDDSFLTRAPDWLPNAMSEVRSRRPPVVIVLDWAINDTEFSRFKNWAAPYMSMLDEVAVRKIARPGMTIYLL